MFCFIFCPISLWLFLARVIFWAQTWVWQKFLILISSWLPISVHGLACHSSLYHNLGIVTIFLVPGGSSLHCLYVCVPVCVEARGWHLCLLQSLCFEVRSLTEQVGYSGWPASSRHPPVCLPHTGVISAGFLCLAFNSVRVWTQVHILHAKHLTNQSISLTPHISIFVSVDLVMARLLLSRLSVKFFKIKTDYFWPK